MPCERITADVRHVESHVDAQCRDSVPDAAKTDVDLARILEQPLVLNAPMLGIFTTNTSRLLMHTQLLV